MKHQSIAEHLSRAQSGFAEDVQALFNMFAPLIRKYSYIDGKIDEELFCELQLATYLCIMRFRVNNEELNRFLSERNNDAAEP